MIYFFLSSGLFLGWSLGANDGANIFGTAVTSRMIPFKTAAYFSALFVILGAIISGYGTSHTIGAIGKISALPAAFSTAFTAALTVSFMTWAKIPVSTSQAVVGSIIGWNIYTHTQIDFSQLAKIAFSWISSPFLAALSSFIIYKFIRYLLKHLKIHMLKIDSYTRYGLLFVALFGAFSLGANNVGNVIGVFLPANPFPDIKWLNITIKGDFILILTGGLAIGFGMITYSKNVISTVGKDIFSLSPITALIVVFSESLVLFLFSSKELALFLETIHLPSIPLVPLSSSQAVIGAVLGIGLAKKMTAVKYSILFKIASGWVLTPLIAFLLSFLSLFFTQNVFLFPIQ